MTSEFATLVHGYLDFTLAPDDEQALERMLRDDPAQAREFAAAVLLHDRLRAECRMAALNASSTPRSPASPIPSSPTAPASAPSTRRRRRWTWIAVALAVMAAVPLLLLLSGGQHSVAEELRRVLSANAEAPDSTWRIVVESSRPHGGRRGRQENRPPKPPLDGALLHVRSGGRFVLIRRTASGEAFVTGSDGRISWAVRPDGPVRASDDLTRFSRDLPGHEHSIPLVALPEDLRELTIAYELEFLSEPLGSQDAATLPPRPAGEALRTIVATRRAGMEKRPGRGPARVTMTYAAESGRFRRIHFTDMPYGDELLTLRLDLVEQRDLGARFFEHESHHAPDRVVEFEE